ncbi:ABC transporter ATP-binding protein [Aeromicrobium sp. A1-2]|uniref:ABC transporter ATP-binding protein n=1 Tax=Aeromicrobium sp. A1-2 TaxID=2107713 RepID=UPI000E51CDA0|nr:ABC transporter ATP-binding protein [Aeromicrobium sp. A1-2]AXT85598.1 ABC transporter ATP-binding protein [Aeromicrobium sp. A1-2]
MTGLLVSDIHKSYGPNRVLDGVDLSIPTGSVVAVLGPSGGGKTTLLRIIAGFLDAESGSISASGRSLVRDGRGLPPQRRGIGYVPQEGALFPHLDVAANIMFGIRGSARRTFDLDAVLTLVGLDPALARRQPHQLSGGQQQRVALARAMAPRPDVVLLDEPFSSLDAGLRVETGRAVVRALRSTGATAILVTHDQDEALALCDQVAVLRDGRVAQVAPPVELYRSPVDPAVARFVGSVVVLPGTVADGIATCALGRLPVAAGSPHGAAQILVRPEQIAIATDGSGAEARVDQVNFFGHDATLALTLLDGGQTVDARVMGSVLPVVGDHVTVTVAGQVVVFAASGSHDR